MGDCGVCLTADFDGCCEFFAEKICTSRKVRKCCECGKDILPKEEYERTSGKSDGEFWTASTCLICREIAEAFYCDGRMYGGVLWEQMYETAFEHMTTGCLERLQTVAAKTELMRRWNDWKF